MVGLWIKPLLRFAAAAALATSLASGVAATDAQTTASIPSAAGFDVLFKRLEIGDLSELDTERQRQYLNDLKQLLPPGDQKRRRLLDSQRCLLEFQNANKDGFAFADAELAEALTAKDDAAAIRF